MMHKSCGLYSYGNEHVESDAIAMEEKVQDAVRAQMRGV